MQVLHSCQSIPSRSSISSHDVPDVTADEVGLLSHALKPYRDKVVPSLWRKIEEVSPKAPSIRPLAAALANLDPDDSRWERIDRNVAEAMVTLDPASLGSWLGPLRPVRSRLISRLEMVFRDPTRPELQA